MATPLATVGVSANAPAAIRVTHSLGKQVVPTPSLLFAPIGRRFSVNPTYTRTASSSPLIAIAIGVVLTKYCHARRAFYRPIAAGASEYNATRKSDIFGSVPLGVGGSPQRVVKNWSF